MLLTIKAGKQQKSALYCRKEEKRKLFHMQMPEQIMISSLQNLWLAIKYIRTQIHFNSA